MPVRPEIIVVGAGGHARVLIGILQSTKRFRIKGLLDEKPSQKSESVLGVQVIGSWRDLERFRTTGVRYAALAVGDNAARQNLMKRLVDIGYQLPALVHKQAYVEPTAIVESGAVICMGALIGAGAILKEGVLVNTGTIVDHETVLNSFVHVAPGSAIAGRVTIGTGTFVGIGSRIIDHVMVGEWSLIGAGSVVVKNIPDHVTAFGVPAQIQKGNA